MIFGYFTIFCACINLLLAWIVMKHMPDNNKTFWEQIGICVLLLICVYISD
jgi:DNA-binding transcriptional regulator of glucitol operon